MAELILKNTRATLEITFSAGVADGTVTVTATGANGTVVSTGSATHGTGGAYSYVLTPQSELNTMVLTWAGVWGGVAQSITTEAEIVGGTLFGLADLRAFGDQVLADTVKYPDEALRETRDRITDLFEQTTQSSFIPRFQYDTLDGSGSGRLWLSKKRPRRLISITVAGSALTAPDLALVTLYQTGHIDRDAAWPADRANIIVAYEYGWPATPPDVSRAAMVLARYELVNSDISDRMIRFDTDLGQVQLSVPGRDYPTGIPIVDATLFRYDECVPAGGW